jgi:hypothetical protein
VVPAFRQGAETTGVEALRVKVASLLFCNPALQKDFGTIPLVTSRWIAYGKFRNSSKKPEAPKGEKAHQQQAQGRVALLGWRAVSSTTTGARAAIHDHETRVNFNMDQIPGTQNVYNTPVAIFACRGESSFLVKTDTMEWSLLR